MRKPPNEGLMILHLLRQSIFRILVLMTLSYNITKFQEDS